MNKVGGLRVCHSINDIKNNTRYTFNTDELCEFKNDAFKYIDDSHIIDFSIGYYDRADYEKIYDFIIRLDKNGKKCKVVVNSPIDNRDLFNSIFLNDKLQNVKLYVYSDNYIYSLKNYLKEEKVLNNLVRPIKEQDFSPLERFIAVYNLVKNFKTYRGHETNYDKSTCLKCILYNEYIVCLGFSKLLIALCHKVGIKVSEVGVTIDRENSTKYKKDNRENDRIKVEHSRCIVSIDDDIYDVHGLYMTDPTWDNELRENLFNHALMTFDKMQVSYDMFYYSFDEPILDIHNFKEFNEQINFLLKSIINEDRWVHRNNYKMIQESYFSLLLRVLSVIDCDPMYDYFNSKLSLCQKVEDYEELLTELGNYLLTRINKKIDDYKIINAVLYTDDMLGNENDEEEIIDNYYTLEFMKFPYRVDKKREHRLIKKRTFTIYKP